MLLKGYNKNAIIVCVLIWTRRNNEMMKKSTKKVIVTILACCLAFAGTEKATTREQVIKVKAETTAIPISDADELYNINNDLGGNYYLTKDIDMKEYGRWEPIEAFYGTLDGRGHAIKNLTTVTDNECSGLFATIGGNATIENLAMINANITGKYAGGIVGKVEHYFRSRTLNSCVGYDGNITIKNCYVSGNVTGNAYCRGGIVGGYIYYEGTVTISNCFNESKECEGGIVGLEGSPSPCVSAIENCYNAADCYSGGIAGTLKGTVRNCYSTGNIVNIPLNNPGGVVGTAEQNAYLLNSYYLRDSKAQINTSLKGVGKTSDSSGQSANGLNKNAMQNESSFKNWDFANTWEMVSGVNDGMPVLRSLRKYFKASKATADKSDGKYYSEPFFVTLEAADGVTIYYTTDGTKPRKNSAVYTAPIEVSKNTTLKYFTEKSGYKNSEITTKKYKIRTPKGKADKKAGVYKKKVSVRLTAPKGTAIYYTTDGKTPTEKSKVYKKKLTLKKSTTLKFITAKEGWSNSAVSTVKYVIQ